MIPQYVIQASPLSKLFMPEWTKKCEEDPDLVFSTKEFTVQIPRTHGALKLIHNKPVHISKLDPPSLTRVKDEYLVDDLDGLVLWLVGGEDGMASEETDIYGVVGLNIDMDLSSALSDVAIFDAENPEDGKKAAKKFEDVQKALITKTRSAMVAATELANQRVMRAMKNTHINLMKQHETLKIEGKGVYAPSVAEAVGAYVLKNEINKSSENRKRMVDLLNATMKDNSIHT